MSNGSSSPNPRRIRGSVAITLAALVPACFAGWLLWQAVSGPGDGGSATPSPAASGSRS
ncbi:MAG TPA: N-acetylmuramoyl-L-alanine amidase, partial [Streptomyces sp.]|nr:N-acetylmuramoyl-L-alanine amidase [Streptomyces sp.]